MFVTRAENLFQIGFCSLDPQGYGTDILFAVQSGLIVGQVQRHQKGGDKHQQAQP